MNEATDQPSADPTAAPVDAPAAATPAPLPPLIHLPFPRAHLVARGSTCRRVPGIHRFVVDELEEAKLAISGYAFEPAEDQDTNDFRALLARVEKITA